MPQDSGVDWHPAGARPHGLRDFNARLVLSMLRARGPLAAAEVARLTGLSAQTVSVIARDLEADGLVRRGEPVRGRVGKPSRPLVLDPTGAYSIGLRIGRRSVDVALVDLTGHVIDQRSQSYSFPRPEPLLEFTAEAVETLRADLPADRRDRLVGLGIGAPFELWNWLEAVGAPKEDMAAWKDYDFADACAQRTGLDVLQANDATLACYAEHLFSGVPGRADFGYFYVGAFIGGGIVTEGRVRTGASGNAGAFGPIPIDIRPDGQPRQLIEEASIYLLERRLAAAGLDPQLLRRPGDAAWEGFDEVLSDWLDDTARALAIGAIAITAIMDLPVLVVDGRFPEHVRHDLARRTAEALGRLDAPGLVLPRIEAGRMGRLAGAVGAAYMPLAATHMIPQDGLA